MNIAITYQNERLAEEAKDLIDSLPGAEGFMCDVSKDEEIARLFATLKERYGKLHTLVHSVAYAPADELKGNFFDTSREGFRVALDVSVYSLVALARGALARPDLPKAHGRKVAFVGRSMVRNMGVARDLGYLHIPSVPGGLMVDMREAEEMPPERIVLISTGSQGEPMSALSRMAGRDHPIRIAAGDTVILASSLIPGNETAVYRVINGLTRLGARVVHKASALVHVSGHAPAGELLYVLNLVRPRNFMPVHGEWRHLRAHARLAGGRPGVGERLGGAGSQRGDRLAASRLRRTPAPQRSGLPAAPPGW